MTGSRGMSPVSGIVISSNIKLLYAVFFLYCFVIKFNGTLITKICIDKSFQFVNALCMVFTTYLKFILEQYWNVTYPAWLGHMYIIYQHSFMMEVPGKYVQKLSNQSACILLVGLLLVKWHLIWFWSVMRPSLHTFAHVCVCQSDVQVNLTFVLNMRHITFCWLSKAGSKL